MEELSNREAALTLEDFAAITAALDAGKPRVTVLAEAGLSSEAWAKAQERWPRTEPLAPNCARRPVLPFSPGAPSPLAESSRAAGVPRSLSEAGSSRAGFARQEGSSSEEEAPTLDGGAAPRGDALPFARAASPEQEPETARTLPLAEDSAAGAGAPVLPFVRGGSALPLPPPSGPGWNRVGLPFRPPAEPAARPAAPPAPFSASAQRVAGSVTLAQYAQICADVRAYPEHLEEIRGHYHLDGEAWTALHALWQARL